MNDEQIKEIILALIAKGLFHKGVDNEATAVKIASFIKTLRAELN